MRLKNKVETKGRLCGILKTSRVPTGEMTEGTIPPVLLVFSHFLSSRSSLYSVDAYLSLVFYLTLI